MTDSVRHLFPQLLANGYLPIPNENKISRLKNWSTVLIDEEQCRRWSRSTRWKAIGLRVEPPLLVFDLDLPDAKVAAAVRAVLPAAVLAGLERIGNPPKTALFLRMATTDEPFYELHTRRFHFEAQPKTAFAVQAFAGGGGAKQMGAFGPHSHDEHGEVLKTYAWVGGRSPADVPLSALPQISRAEVAAVIDAADTVLGAAPGMVVDQLSTKGLAHFKQPYDTIDENTVFTDVDGTRYTVEELIEEAKARRNLRQPELRLTGSFTGDPHSTGSARCKVHWSQRTGLSITDFKTSTTHRYKKLPDDPELDKLFEGIIKTGKA